MSVKISQKLFSILYSPIYELPKTKTVQFIKYFIFYLFLYFIYFEVIVLFIGIIFNPFNLQPNDSVISSRTVIVKEGFKWIFETPLTALFTLAPIFFAVRSANRKALASVMRKNS